VIVRVDFYHLTATPLERVLPNICEKLLGAGERVLVVTSPARVAQLDRDLWTSAPDSFLPHGAVGGGRDDSQPILISDSISPANEARNIALADGQWRDEALSFDRAFYFFDTATIDNARSAWRGLKDRAETERHYWKQDDEGRWVQGP
jgi:DNA polymerase-3 subunit chi